MAELTNSWLDYANPDITYVDSSLSCHTGFYIPHLVFSYMVGFSGLLCLVTRLHPRLHCAHVWFGRIYLLSMLWATAMSILIHNHGLPLGVLWSFLWVLGGLTLGWMAIIFYQGRMQRLALTSLSNQAAATGTGLTGDLVKQVAQEKKRIAESRTFWQRILSLKTVHGVFMFLSWINIFGRIVATRPPRDFTCWTYPVFKPFNTRHGPGADKPLEPVPFEKPSERFTPWGRVGTRNWAIIMLVAPMVAALLFGCVWALMASRRGRRSSAAARLRKDTGSDRFLNAKVAGPPNGAMAAL